MIAVLSIAILLQHYSGLPWPVSTSAVVVIGLLCWSFRRERKQFRAIEMANIDIMSGTEFEQYLKKLLTLHGYSVTTTPVSGNLGVDLIASRGRDRIAIQVKRHRGKVSRRAVSDAVAGIPHYGCNQAMVITNSHFTPGAAVLAQSTNCILVDRKVLAQWIVEAQSR